MSIDVAKMRALCDAATSGPWTYENDGTIGGILVRPSHGRPHRHDSAEDAAFIAAARTAVPELLDEIERLQSTEYAMEQWHAHHGKNAELLAELEQLRESFDFMRNRYSVLGGRGCDLCVCEDGVFIRPCKLHEAEDMLAQLRAPLMAAADKYSKAYWRKARHEAHAWREHERRRAQPGGAPDEDEDDATYSATMDMYRDHSMAELELHEAARGPTPADMRVFYDEYAED